MNRGPWLITFAVPTEARPFQRATAGSAQVHTFLTGIGPESTRSSMAGVLRDLRPSLVITSGFAGGLHPDLQPSEIVYDAEEAPGLQPVLKAGGARPTRFHTVSRVVGTPREKARLRQNSGAEAVEMESGVIRDLCRQAGIPCAIVRVISDTATESLPLDFEALLDRQGRIIWPRFLWAIARHPAAVPGLIRLGRSTRLAAERLATLLVSLLPVPQDHPRA